MTWLTTSEAALLENTCARNMRIRVKKDGKENADYRYIKSSAGRGGRQIEISLDFLSEQAQQAYHNQHNDECQPVFNTDFISTKAQKEKGNLREEAVTKYKSFLKRCKKEGMKKKTEIMDLYIQQWNREHDFKISQKKLYDWMAKKKKGKSLVDKRGGYNRGQCSIDEKYIQRLRSLYLQQTQPPLESCFREILIEANRNGDTIPGIHAFRNYIQGLNKALVILAREGPKAFEDKCMPHTERDYSLLHPNQWWVSDHHLWDVFVRIPDGKGGWKPARPWGSYWMDMRTRKIMSSIIRIESPNSDIVLCSFGLGVEHFGIPDGVRLDNGKDYKARDMFYPEGHYLASEEDEKMISSSLAANLQIEVTYAIPYNAKAKPIERFFRTAESQFGKKFQTYAGSDAKHRPEDLKGLDIMEYPTLEDFIKQHNEYVYEVYNETKHSGDAMYEKSPNRLYAELPFTIRRTSKETLYFSLMRVGLCKVGRNGVTFRGEHFYNDNFIEHFGKEVIARYDPTKPEILYIFDINENFLFIAKQVVKQGWNPTDEEYQKENQRKKVAKQKALNSYTTDNVIRSTESIGERLKRQAESIERAEIANPKTVKMVRNEPFEEAARQISMPDIDRNYEKVLNQNKAKKKAVTERQKEYIDRFNKKFLDMALEN